MPSASSGELINQGLRFSFWDRKRLLILYPFIALLLPFTVLTVRALAAPRARVERLLNARERDRLTKVLRAAQVELVRQAEGKQGYHLLGRRERGAGVLLRSCLILSSSSWVALRAHEEKVSLSLRGNEARLEVLSLAPALGLVALRPSNCQGDHSTLKIAPWQRVNPAETLYALRLTGGQVERVTFLGQAPHPFSFFDWTVAALAPGLPLFNSEGALVSLVAREHPERPNYLLFIPPQAIRELISSLADLSAPPREDVSPRRWWSRRLSED